MNEIMSDIKSNFHVGSISLGFPSETNSSGVAVKAKSEDIPKLLRGQLPQSAHMYLSTVKLVFNKQICPVMLYTDVLKILPSAVNPSELIRLPC